MLLGITDLLRSYCHLDHSTGLILYFTNSGKDVQRYKAELESKQGFSCL